MGLDITAYSKLKKLDVLFNNDGEPVDPVTREPVEDYYKVRANHDFSGRADGLEDGACYSYAESEHVFARSYSGYNVWRETLARLAGYQLYSFLNTFGVQENSHAASGLNCWARTVRALSRSQKNARSFWERARRCGVSRRVYICVERNSARRFKRHEASSWPNATGRSSP